MKYLELNKKTCIRPGHSLRGVWVEIQVAPVHGRIAGGHSLRGVWVEIGLGTGVFTAAACHSLRGVWVEISAPESKQISVIVTPFGECGLKFRQIR